MSASPPAAAARAGAASAVAVDPSGVAVARLGHNKQHLETTRCDSHSIVYIYTNELRSIVSN